MKHILIDTARAFGHVVAYWVFWISFCYLAFYFNASVPATSGGSPVFWLVIDGLLSLGYIFFYVAIKRVWRIQHEQFLVEQAEREAKYQAKNDEFGQKQANYYGHNYFWLGKEYSPTHPRETV